MTDFSYLLTSHNILRSLHHDTLFIPFSLSFSFFISLSLSISLFSSSSFYLLLFILFDCVAITFIPFWMGRREKSDEKIIFFSISIFFFLTSSIPLLYLPLFFSCLYLPLLLFFFFFLRSKIFFCFQFTSVRKMRNQGRKIEEEREKGRELRFFPFPFTFPFQQVITKSERCDFQIL